VGANKKRGSMMNFSPTEIALILVLVSGYVIGVTLGTVAYFANEKNY
jgi:hypothetical protein